MPEGRLFYLLATVEVSWTRAVLLNQIKANAFERSRKVGKQHNFPAALTEALAAQAEDTLKGSCDFSFLGIENIALERELEESLLDRLRDFILELGYGFGLSDGSTD